MKISIKLRVFSDRLFVSSHGGEGDVHRGLIECEGVGNSWLGCNRMLGGWGNSGGSTVGVSLASKNPPSHHKSPEQFELKQS